MNSLTAFNRLPQLKAIPIPGTPMYRYVQKIAGNWVSCNHSRVTAIVGVYNRKVKALVHGESAR